MKKLLIFSAFLVALATTSCNKTIDSVTDIPASSGGSIEDLLIPAGFDWSTQRTIQVNVPVKSSQMTTLEFYDANPYDGGQLIGRGGASSEALYSGLLTVSKNVSKIFILATSPSNSNSMYEVAIADVINVDLSSAELLSTDGAQLMSSTETSPDCTTGCDFTTTLTNGASFEVHGGKTYCASGSNLSFNVTFGLGGGTLRVCGTGLKIQNLNNNANGANAAIIVTKGSELSLSNLNFNRAVESVTNFGTLTFTGNYSGAGPIINYGTMKVFGDYNINSGNTAVTHKNFGVVTISNSLNINSGNTFDNQSKLTVGTNMNVNGGGILNNTCSVIINGEYNNNNITNNYGYIKVARNAHLNGNSNLKQYSGAMLSVNYLYFDGTITGNNSSSLVKVATKTNFNGSGLLTGFVQLYSINGFDANNGKIQNGASVGSDLYIESTTCNPEGNGKPICVDADKDGVCDNVDAYPNDPLKAYNNNVATGTLAFEDNWPYTGDYDLNDLLMEYNYNVVTNAANTVVRVEARYKLRATGGSNKNGFGVQFPVDRSKVTNVTGAKLEDGQSKAVLIVFDNMRNELAAWNTFKNQSLVAEKTYKVSFDITDGPSLATFGLSAYNPFIWNGSKDRGYEIHLAGKQPTDKADKQLMGSGLDQTSFGGTKNYYTKNKGLIWGLNIPGRFDYPSEFTSIDKVYLKFGAWAQSGGTLYNDWYTNSPGYRTSDGSKIFVW